MIIYKIILAIAINLNFTTDICVILQEFNKYFLFYIIYIIDSASLPFCIKSKEYESVN